MDLRAIQNKPEPDCAHCDSIPKMLKDDEEYICLNCGVLHVNNYDSELRARTGCYFCEGKGETYKSNIKSVCCENFLEIGMCCMIEKLVIVKTPIKCIICDGTGKRKNKC